MSQETPGNSNPNFQEIHSCSSFESIFHYIILSIVIEAGTNLSVPKFIEVILESVCITLC